MSKVNPLYMSDKRTDPKAGGMNASCMSSAVDGVSTDSWRTGDKGRSTQAPHRGSPHAQRFGVKPTGGAVSELWVARHLLRSDPMLAEWSERACKAVMAAAKTAREERAAMLADLVRSDIVRDKESIAFLKAEVDFMVQHSGRSAVFAELREALRLF